MFYGELVSRLAIEYCMLRYHRTDSEFPTQEKIGCQASAYIHYMDRKEYSAGAQIYLIVPVHSCSKKNPS